MVVRNPFNPFMVEPASPPTTVANLERRAEMATKALEQAERDLETARNRAAAADEKRRERMEREGTLAERKRLMTILFSPVSLRHPRIAKRFAFESDSPADEAIEALEQYERENAANSAKAASDLIILAGRKARGELPCDVNAGPKTMAKATAELILAAARKARGEA